MPGTLTFPSLSPEHELKNGPLERRFYPRVRARTTIPVSIVDTVANILDVSENGLTVSTQHQVAPDMVSLLSIELNGVAKPIEVAARVVWAEESTKLAGVQLLNLSETDREQIRKWQEQEMAVVADWHLEQLAQEKSFAPSVAEREKILTALPLVIGGQDSNADPLRKICLPMKA